MRRCVKIRNAATKTGIDAAKAASKRVVANTAEATGDLIGNKIVGKITSFSKTKSQEKEKEEKKSTYQQKKDSRLLMIWDCLRHHIKMEYHKIANLLDTAFDEVPRFVIKIWI